jgi:hypothetical protein
MIDLGTRGGATLVDRWASRPVLVTTAPLSEWRRLLTWGAQDAARRDVGLVVASAIHPGERPVGESFASALAILRKSKPPVRARVIPVRPDGSDLLELARTAGRFVLSATGPHVHDLAMNADCPVVIVPDLEQTGQGPVVLGVAPWTAEHVIETAFREATVRGVPLEAVRARSRGADAEALPRPTAPGTDDAESARARRELDLALSFWTGRYPDVEVRRHVTTGAATSELGRLAQHAQLLVLGRSVRGLDLAARVRSPITNVIGDVRCPAMVVPG